MSEREATFAIREEGGAQIITGLAVPYGETRSYQDLALAVGDPAAVRAVGRANGMNRIAILIPCHRIVNKNGDLGGYGGGLRRKQYLLNLEKAAVTEPA